MSFKLFAFCLLLSLLEVICLLPTTLKIELVSFNLNSKGVQFSCHSPTSEFPESGACDVDIIFIGCSLPETSSSFEKDLIDNSQGFYTKRYQNNGFEEFNKYVIERFKNAAPDKAECYTSDPNTQRFYKAMNMDVKVNGTIFKLDFDVQRWYQRIIIWIGVISRGLFYNEWQNKVWYAELFTNKDFIANAYFSSSYITLNKDVQKFGKNALSYEFSNLNTEFKLQVNFTCKDPFMGILCSVRCTPSYQNECDRLTGNQICKDGWLPNYTDSNLDITSNRFWKCTIKDGCYLKPCDGKECVIISTGEGICIKSGLNISTPSLCVSIATSIKCLMPTYLPPKEVLSIMWTTDYMDNNTIIKGDIIAFNEATVLTMPASCVVTINSIVKEKQFITTSFQFMVYDSKQTLYTSISEGIVIYGENIGCVVSGWDMAFVYCSIVALEPSRLILDRNSDGTYQVNARSSFGKTGINVTATLNTSCKNDVTFTLSKQFLIAIKGFQYFDWQSGNKNEFYKDVDDDIFDCVTIPFSATNKIEVVILERPSEHTYSGFERGDFIPGAYYIACQLGFLDSSYTNVIYKYLRVNYIPTTKIFFVFINETTLDSLVRCLPLPYPEDEFTYSISFFSVNNPGKKIGYAQQHTISLILFDIPPNVPTLIQCKIISKQNMSLVVKADLTVTFKGWTRPILLRYWRTRIWTEVFLGTALLMFIIIPLSWLIHIKSIGAISATFLTRRSLVLTNLKRRNATFYINFSEWIENLNTIIQGSGTTPLTFEEAQDLIKSDTDLAKDLSKYLSKQIKDYNSLYLLEKQATITNQVKELRNKK